MLRRAMILAVMLALLTAACGGAGDDGVATLGAGSEDPANDSIGDAAERVDDEEALLAFASCMRDNGVEDFPDPSMNADGSVDFGATSGDPFADVDDETAQAAVNACIRELEGAAFAPGGSDFDLTEIQDALVEFAACMRDNGIDVDDPDLSSFGLGGGEFDRPFGDLDIDDPEVAAAIEECRVVFTDLGLGLGG